VTSATARVSADLAALGRVHGALVAALESEGWTGEPASRVPGTRGLMMRALAEEMQVRRCGSGTEVLLVFGREALAA
jgi:hypothetical protein